MVDANWQDLIRKKFDNPPTPEQRKEYFGDALIYKWKTEFEKRVWDSPQYAEISFHTLFGQLQSVKDKRIIYENNVSDMRVHLILFQRSGTGKGRGYNFTMEMAGHLNLHCFSADAMTDGVLLGSFIHEEGQREPVRIRGILDENRIPQISILIQNEATLIIDTKKTDISKDFMNYFQKAMNTIGTPDNLIEKSTLQMRGQTIRIQPEVSFLFTTYVPEKLLEVITKTGYLQRMICLYNNVSFDKRTESWETLAGVTGVKSSGVNYIPDIIDAMNYIQEHYRRNPKIEMSKQANESCKNVMRQIYKPLLKVNEAMREHLADFVPRTYENVIKLAHHHAMCRLSSTVDTVDIGYGLKTLQPAWIRMITYMEESDSIIAETLKKWERHRKDAFRVYDMILEEQKKKGKEADGWVKKGTMVKLLSSKIYGWDKTKETTRSRLNKLTSDLKYFTEGKNGEGITCLKKVDT